MAQTIPVEGDLPGLADDALREAKSESEVSCIHEVHPLPRCSTNIAAA
jgi:hypothetical protein